MSQHPTGPGQGLLGDLVHRREAHTGRVSSWDHSGENQDNWTVMPGETVTLAELEGPGCITHIWLTQASRRRMGPSEMPQHIAGVGMFDFDLGMGVHWDVPDPDYYRKMVIEMYWDDQETPSVVAPLGDFFGILNSITRSYESAPLSASVHKNSEGRFGGYASLNSYFQMPFRTGARILLRNESDIPYLQYFHIDYELYRKPLPEDTLYFHAHWRRTLPGTGWAPDLQANSREVAYTKNLTGNDNYVVLDTTGAGHYVGCNLAVTSAQGTWWGEGDDMFFIDGEEWPPSVHGTGTEDYFGHAWGMQDRASQMYGSILHIEDKEPYQHSFRFHLLDPVRFDSSLRVTLEHGHNNHLSDDWASTAYWYQTLPSPRLEIPSVEGRLPLRPTIDGLRAEAPEVTPQHDAARERLERTRIARDQVERARNEAVAKAQVSNREEAHALRQAYDAAGQGAIEGR
jgi:hypothetical protein